MEPLITDNNYDFNFQEIRKLREERVVTPVRLLCMSGKGKQCEGLRFSPLPLTKVKKEYFLFSLRYFAACQVLSYEYFPPCTTKVKICPLPFKFALPRAFSMIISRAHKN